MNPLKKTKKNEADVKKNNDTCRKTLLTLRGRRELSRLGGLAHLDEISLSLRHSCENIMCSIWWNLKKAIIIFEITLDFF